MSLETHPGIALDHDGLLSGDLRHDNDDLQAKARDHLWMHFTRQSNMHEVGVPIIVRGEGHTIYDTHGRSYIDGLSGLFTVNAGYGRRRLVEAATKQMEELAYFPIWSYAHPSAIELADRLADYAPGDLNRVFFATGGGEANDVRAYDPLCVACHQAKTSARTAGGARDGAGGAGRRWRERSPLAGRGAPRWPS
jgi:adenosylmethionine-8-amino-7-oxononanoate aminotransferase